MTSNLNVVRLALRESYTQIRNLARGFGQRDSLAQSVLWLYVVQASTYLLPVISLTYLARVLSVETFGLIGYAQAFAKRILPDAQQSPAEAVRSGMRYLYEDGLRQVIEGITSINELLRVCK